MGAGTTLEVTARSGRQRQQYACFHQNRHTFPFLPSQCHPKPRGLWWSERRWPGAPASAHRPFSAVISVVGVFHSISISSLLCPSLISLVLSVTLISASLLLSEVLLLNHCPLASCGRTELMQAVSRASLAVIRCFCLLLVPSLTYWTLDFRSV